VEVLQKALFLHAELLFLEEVVHHRLLHARLRGQEADLFHSQSRVLKEVQVLVVGTVALLVHQALAIVDLHMALVLELLQIVFHDLDLPIVALHHRLHIALVQREVLALEVALQ
jgi:hypothetical protein